MMFSTCSTFYDLIVMSESFDHEELRKIYLKNLSFLKTNVKVSKVLPSSASLHCIDERLQKNLKKDTPKKIRNLFSSMKTSLIWALSFYEPLTHRSSLCLKLEDWQCLSNLIKEVDPIVLKNKWFTYLKSTSHKVFWTSAQDQHLVNLIQFYHYSYGSNEISWSKICLEFNAMVVEPAEFQSEKQCKERWENHLNPNLRKKLWTLEDDILLLELNLETPKKWARIAKKMIGRNQHCVKNELFRIVSKKSEVKREMLMKINEEKLMVLIKKSLDILYDERVKLILEEPMNHFSEVPEENTNFSLDWKEKDPEENRNFSMDWKENNREIYFSLDFNHY